MSHEQLLSNLGTIARSGTRKFMEAVKDAKGDANLIGQFGVGFYSAFLVADNVSVLTKSHEDGTAWIWRSSMGSHSYTVKPDDGSAGPPLARGTRVVLHLKEDAADLADPIRLARLIKQYSQFIQFPIKLYSATKEPKQARGRGGQGGRGQGGRVFAGPRLLWRVFACGGRGGARRAPAARAPPVMKIPAIGPVLRKHSQGPSRAFAFRRA